MVSKSRKNRLRMLIRTEKNHEQVFLALIDHPMETGQRRDRETRQLIPADYIEQLRIEVDGRPYIEFGLSEKVSKNPFFSFVFAKPLSDGQHLKVSWHDNHQHETSYEYVLLFGENGFSNFRRTNSRKGIKQVAPKPGPVCHSRQGREGR